MQAVERRYTALGVGAAIVMAALILGYRILISDPYADASNRNHHSESTAAADQSGASE